MDIDSYPELGVEPSSEQTFQDLYIVIYSIHLARWVYSLNQNTKYEWGKACDSYLTHAVTHTCQECVKTLYMHSMYSHVERNEETSTILTYLADPAHDPTVMFSSPGLYSRIRDHVLSLDRDSIVIEPACTCLSYPQSL